MHRMVRTKSGHYEYIRFIEEDEESQKRGIVAVMFHASKDGDPKVDLKTTKEGVEALMYFPIRVSCIHHRESGAECILSNGLGRCRATLTETFSNPYRSVYRMAIHVNDFWDSCPFVSVNV